MLLQRKWKEPIIPPTRCFRPKFSALPYWTRQWTTPSNRAPEWFYLLPGGQLFLIGKSYALGIYDLLGRYGHEFDLPGTPMGVDWISTNNGTSISLGILFSRAIGDTMYVTNSSSTAHLIAGQNPGYISFETKPIIRTHCLAGETYPCSVVFGRSIHEAFNRSYLGPTFALSA